MQGYGPLCSEAHANTARGSVLLVPPAWVFSSHGHGHGVVRDTSHRDTVHVASCPRSGDATSPLRERLCIILVTEFVSIGSVLPLRVIMLHIRL